MNQFNHDRSHVENEHVLNCREHDNSSNRAHKSLLKGLENRDKESLAEEIGALRKELLETKEAATRVKQEKQRRERDLHLLGKQVGSSIKTLQLTLMEWWFSRNNWQYLQVTKCKPY